MNNYNASTRGESSPPPLSFSRSRSVHHYYGPSNNFYFMTDGISCNITQHWPYADSNNHNHIVVGRGSSRTIATNTSPIMGSNGTEQNLNGDRRNISTSTSAVDFGTPERLRQRGVRFSPAPSGTGASLQGMVGTTPVQERLRTLNDSHRSGSMRTANSTTPHSIWDSSISSGPEEAWNNQEQAIPLANDPERFSLWRDAPNRSFGKKNNL